MAEWRHPVKLVVRDETPDDVVAIEAVTVEAFRDVARSRHTEQYIVNALRRAGVLAVSLVAERDGVIVGHVALSPVAVSDGATRWYGLGPISVLPAHQRAGIGSALMHAAIEALRRRDAQGCVLLGDPAYYRRFGFAPDPGLTLDGVPPQNFQALGLGATMPHGTVTYHAAFAATSQPSGDCITA
jgi:predicted N-acetyltransferase YhbS